MYFDSVVFEETRFKRIRAASLVETSHKSQGVVDQITFDLPPGNYTLTAKMTDKNCKAFSSTTTDFQILEFDQQLCMSEPQLATLISSDISRKQFIKSNRMVLPSASRRYRYQNSILYLYFEIYNLAAPIDSSGDQFEIGYLVTDILGDTLILTSMQTIAKPGTSCIKMQALDIRGLERGEHVLTVIVTDPASDTTIIGKKNFWIYVPEQETQILPMTNNDIKKYREQIQYFASYEELKLFDELPLKAKETFLLNFWRAKDTTPETPENEFMQNAFSRIDYANRNFKGKRGGLNSDMGRIFVIYGQPDDVENHLMRMNSKSYIIWYYYIAGSKHMFVFVDRNNEGIFSLVHSTVLEEIKNENWMEQELY